MKWRRRDSGTETLTQQQNHRQKKKPQALVIKVAFDINTFYDSDKPFRLHAKHHSIIQMDNGE